MGRLCFIPYHHPAFDVGREVWGVCWGCADVGERDWQTWHGEKIATALKLKMEMWFGGVARIAAARNAFTTRDGLADVYTNTAGFEMSE